MGSLQTGSGPAQETPNKDTSHLSWSKVSSAPSAADKPPNGTSSWSELSDIREKQRQKWREFKEKRQNQNHVRIKQNQDQDQDRTRAKARTKAGTKASAEPIVLSSEEEEEEEEDHSDIIRRSSSSQSERSDQTQVSLSSLSSPPPSFLQLDFTSFHMGLSRAEATGKSCQSESSIQILIRTKLFIIQVRVLSGPVLVRFFGGALRRGVSGSGVRSVGRGVARGGTLFSDSTHSPSGPAPTLLFLWITDAQSKLLWAELREIQPQNSDPPCPLVLLVLKQQLSDLDSALVQSVLDSGDYTKSRSEPGAGPLDWSQGLVLSTRVLLRWTVTCCSCWDTRSDALPWSLGLLWVCLFVCFSSQTCLCLCQSSSGSSSRTRTRTGLRSGAAHTLSSRLIQYPAAPSKGRISVSSEDLLCLNQGEFLNDVIIDFYLKYLLLEGVGGAVAQRSHVFSSFFYKQLSKRRAAGEDDVASVPSHWFLVVVCFPGLEEPNTRDFKPSSDSVRPGFGLRSQTPPECTQKGFRKTTVLHRPCLLVMDSLKLSHHENVCRLLRDYLCVYTFRSYLQVEWEVRRGSKRLFSPESVKNCNCRVPQQDNSSDCGVYLLQNAQSFLQVRERGREERGRERGRRERRERERGEERTGRRGEEGEEEERQRETTAPTVEFILQNAQSFFSERERREGREERGRWRGEGGGERRGGRERPERDNSSDCGVYLLQNAQSFLQVKKRGRREERRGEERRERGMRGERERRRERKRERRREERRERPERDNSSDCEREKREREGGEERETRERRERRREEERREREKRGERGGEKRGGERREKRGMRGERERRRGERRERERGERGERRGEREREEREERDERRERERGGERERERQQLRLWSEREREREGGREERRERKRREGRKREREREKEREEERRGDEREGGGERGGERRGERQQLRLWKPVVNFDLPVRLETWYPRQQVRDKREEIRSLILRLHQDQTGLYQD
ncbi:hypothetical protein WMY93_031538 [Mugilogobius chulae]|uniref:Ubiquitin-like protease family profile domain-containing protein n=1 Tax=Mugilogobius chulae TaxID=88201 RepID=A0AAW0MDF1_9GOBI